MPVGSHLHTQLFHSILLYTARAKSLQSIFLRTPQELRDEVLSVEDGVKLRDKRKRDIFFFQLLFGHSFREPVSRSNYQQHWWPVELWAPRHRQQQQKARSWLSDDSKILRAVLGAPGNTPLLLFLSSRADSYFPGLLISGYHAHFVFFCFIFKRISFFFFFFYFIFIFMSKRDRKTGSTSQ